MGAGEYRDRVVIQEKTETKDSLGNREETWTEFKKVWASVKDLSGREYFAAQQENAEVSSKIKIRYLDGINQTMRVIFGARFFDIKTIIKDKHKGEIVLMCREAVV